MFAFVASFLFLSTLLLFRMPYIRVVQPNGTYLQTDYLVGSTREREYFSVMTERWGKIFFDKGSAYRRWKRSGRAKNLSLGYFINATKRLQREMIQDAMLDPTEDAVIVEEYTVVDSEEGGRDISVRRAGEGAVSEMGWARAPALDPVPALAQGTSARRSV